MFCSGNLDSSMFILVFVLIFFWTCYAGDLEIRCEKPKKNTICVYEEGDEITLVCSIRSSDASDSGVSDFLIHSAVAFALDAKPLNTTLVKQRNSFEVEIKLTAALGLDGKFFSCSVDPVKSRSLSVFVIAKPNIPAITRCQEIQSSPVNDSSPIESFQCSWKPTVLEESMVRKGKVVQTLYWARKSEGENISSLEWKSCPQPEDGSCTWRRTGNHSLFFADEDGSTDGWENCVQLVVHQETASDGVSMKNHFSKVHCFSMAVEVAESGISKAAVVGITLGVMAAVILVVGGLLYYRRQKKMSNLKIEVPEATDIQMAVQEDHYYDPDEIPLQTTWEESWLSTATTPSTANSAAPLITSNGQHFAFQGHSNPHSNKTYVKSKPPSSTSRLNNEDQSELIRRLLSNNNDKSKDAVSYAVICNPQEADKPNDNISNNYEDRSDYRGLRSRNQKPDLAPGCHEDHRDYLTDGIYTCDTPLSVDETTEVGTIPDLPSPSGNSMTVYTVIAPNPSDIKRSNDINGDKDSLPGDDRECYLEHSDSLLHCQLQNPGVPLAK